MRAGTEKLLLGCDSCAMVVCLHRTLSGLSQVPSQQHMGLSRTVRRYPANAASGQLTSNALPVGLGLEQRDGPQQAASPNHLLSPWGKAALPQD